MLSTPSVSAQRNSSLFVANCICIPSVLHSSLFDRRPVTGHALPCPAGHLHPRVRPALVFIQMLSGPIRALAIEDTVDNSRIAECRHLHTSLVAPAFPVGGFGIGQGLRLAADLA